VQHSAPGRAVFPSLDLVDGASKCYQLRSRTKAVTAFACRRLALANRGVVRFYLYVTLYAASNGCSAMAVTLRTIRSLLVTQK
jgi:hypothetical protein